LAGHAPLGYPPGVKSELHNAGGWIERHAALAPERDALIEAAGVGEPSRRFGYAAWNERIQRLAGWLSAQGIRPGDRVAALLGNRAATLEILFASARLGAIFLPMNTRLAPREIAFLLDDCRPKILFHESELTPRVESACARGAHTPAHRLGVGESPCRYEGLLADTPPRSELLAVDPEDPMILMYTSGTTGKPKGALLPHRKTFYNSLNAQLFFGIRHDDRVGVPVPLFHSLGLNILSLPAFYVGATVVLEARFDASLLWQRVSDERLTYLGAVPTLYRELLDALRPGADTSSLRFLFTAGAAIPVELLRAYEARGLCLKQGYGQTETSILCCLDAQDAYRKAGSVGRPVFHGEVRVVATTELSDPPARWRECAPGETGEIVARGPITMLGYWERADASAETLREGWVLTGDLARRDAEGFLTLVGRRREMFVSGGENVYPVEVENVFREHPDVVDVAVVGIPDERWGEVGRAHLVLRSGAAFDAAAFEHFARESLAAFKVPKTYVVEKDLPRTVTGKVLKYRLQEPA